MCKLQNDASESISVSDVKDMIEGIEEPQEESNVYHVNKITFEERDKMREKTTQLNADAYNDVEFKYDQVMHQLSAWDLQLETLKTTPFTQKINNILLICHYL